MAVVAALVAGVAMGAVPAHADEGAPRLVVNGLARGQVARLVPYVGLPGFGAALGVAQAEVAGPAARASAGLTDFGNISLVLGAVGAKVPVPLPPLPGPVTADSSGTQQVVRDPLLAQASDLLPGLPATPQSPGGALEEAHAVPDPAARARVVGAGLAAPELLTIAGGESRADAVPGLTSSTVTLSRLALGGGEHPAVVLSDLVWTARHPAGQAATASFSLGAATVAGQPVDVAGPDGLAGLVAAANPVLAAVGLYLEAPVVTTDAAGGVVSALVVQFRNPEPTAAVLGTVTKPAGPVANQVLDALIAAVPDAEPLRLVVNAALANGSGRSGGRLELGGASARLGTTEVAMPEQPFIPPDPLPAFDGLPAPSPAEPLPPADPYPAPAFDFTPVPTPAPAFTGVPGVPRRPTGRTAEPHPAAPEGATLTALPTLVPQRTVGGRSAPLVLGIALVVVLVLAGGDRLRLRKAS
ncbi:MAG: hypothetical protein ACRD1K_20410 [Acidimicrobiales bacterium]